jgi:ribosomal protein S18 acetylase RimI-like enzyme
MQIREYKSESDLPAIRNCAVELQDFERALDPRLPEGEKMADAYLAEILDRVRKFEGNFFFAEIDGRVVGLVTVLGAYRLEEPSETHLPFAYVDDLLVLAKYRGQGIGKALLAEAEAYAQRCGRASIRLRVKGGNQHARAFYTDAGYSEHELELEKRL